MRIKLLAVLLLSTAGVASADTLWMFERTNINNLYPQSARIESDRVEGGLRTVRWTGLLMSEQEPRRSEGRNQFAFQYRGVPQTLQPGGRFSLHYKWQRTFAGTLDGRPYKHEARITFGDLGGCQPRRPDGSAGGFILDIPTSSDRHEGTIEYTCRNFVANDVTGFLGPAGRPWGQFNIEHVWRRSDEGRDSGLDIAGNPMNGAIVAQPPSPPVNAAPPTPVTPATPSTPPTASGYNDPYGSPSPPASNNIPPPYPPATPPPAAPPSLTPPPASYIPPQPPPPAMPPSTQPLAGVIVTAYGHNDTTNQQIMWESHYPSPSFGEDPSRRGAPNVRWHGQHFWRGDSLCVAVRNLDSPVPSASLLSIGYIVTLQGGATFEDGLARKTVVLGRFSGTPSQRDFQLCLRVRAANAVPPPAAPTAPTLTAPPPAAPSASAPASNPQECLRCAVDRCPQCANETNLLCQAQSPSCKECIARSCGGGGGPVNAAPPPAVAAPPPGPATINVVGGSYGRSCGAAAGNKTHHLAQACNGRARCDYRIDVAVLGDPSYGCSKDYIAEWRCGNQPNVQRIVANGEAGFGTLITLSCAN